MKRIRTLFLTFPILTGIIFSAFTSANAAITVDFTWTGTCFGGPTNFQSTASSTNGAIIAYYWEFGDGSPGSTLANPLHVYPIAGIWAVTLTVTDILGYQGSVTKNVTIMPLPLANFVADTACAGDLTNFTDLSSTNWGTIVSWYWNFGDPASGANNISTQPNPTHLFSAPGNFQVMLTVTHSGNCSSAITKTVTVDPPPIPNFAFSTGCEDMPIQFTDQSQTNGGGPIISWYWNFGDPASGANNTSNLQNPSHLFADPGVYDVFLYITSIMGCGDTIIKVVPVAISPVADFTFSNTCAGNPVQFTDDSQPGAGTITTWFWDFGDPGSSSNTSTLSDPSHIYVNPGIYAVTLTVTNSGNCSNTITKTVTIYAIPQAAFTYSNPHLNQPVQFTDLSTTSGSPIVQWAWSFGDGNNSSQQNPSHTYTMPGYFLVTLTVQDTSGCNDMASSTLYVPADSSGTTLYGSIVAGTDTINMAHIWIIQIDSSGFPISMLDTTPGLNNVFVFENVPQGKYFLRAIPAPGSVYSSSYLPTYYESTIYWEDATVISLGSPQNPYILTLVEYDSTSGGIFSINGQLVTGGKSISVAQQEILLLDDQDQPVRCVFTDNDGYFSFVSLPGGFYTLYPVITGYTTIPYTVFLDETTNGVFITLTISGQVISGYHHPEPENKGSRVFPNPADHSLFVSSDRKIDRIILTDCRGRILTEKTNPENPTSIDVRSLPGGLYILRTNESCFKIIIRH